MPELNQEKISLLKIIDEQNSKIAQLENRIIEQDKKITDQDRKFKTLHEKSDAKQKEKK